MRPYPKTYRVAKIHKAKECSVCAEQVGQSSSPMRHQAKKEISSEEVTPENIAQKEYNEDEDFYDNIEFW